MLERLKGWWKDGAPLNMEGHWGRIADAFSDGYGCGFRVATSTTEQGNKGNKGLAGPNANFIPLISPVKKKPVKRKRIKRKP